MASSPDHHDIIHVRGAAVNNLKNIDVDIRKRRLTVVTGVSGSGKSSLVFGVIAAESRRLIDETYSAFIQGFMPSLPRPEVDHLENLSPAIIIDQECMGANSRSTVGTATDAYSLLRMLYSRLSTPHVGSSTAFSFNLPEGMCPTCEGSGTAADVDLHAFLDESRSLNDGAIDAPGFGVGDWYWQTYGETGQFDPDKPVRDFTDDEREFFLYAPQQKITVKDGDKTRKLTYEGLITRIRRLWIDRDEPPKQKEIISFVEKISQVTTCPECHGSRPNKAAREATITAGERTWTIPEATNAQVDELTEFITDISANEVAPARAPRC